MAFISGSMHRSGVRRIRPRIELGYQLSSEEHPAPDLVGYAPGACSAGSPSLGVLCGADPDAHVAKVKAFADALPRLREV